MTDDLTTDHPEVAEHIWDAVGEHGEDWVLENYYRETYPLGVLMDVPEKAVLPFCDEEGHDTLDEQERAEMCAAWATYRENLKAASESSNNS